MIKQLQIELHHTREKAHMLQEWLKSHTKHNDFMKIAGDRNHLLVRINTIEFKINQLKKGEPILGQPDGMSVIEMDKIAHQIIKQ